MDAGMSGQRDLTIHDAAEPRPLDAPATGNAAAPGTERAFETGSFRD